MDLITDLMLNDHKKIEFFLCEFENSIKNNKEKTKNIFNIFKWNLEKHFFTEERAIFAFNDLMSNEEVAEIFELMRQHGEIMALIKIIDGNLSAKNLEYIENLKDLIRRHAKFENENFYPKLDENLNDEQKSLILERIKEVVIN